MLVATGLRDQLQPGRRIGFADQFVVPLLAEAGGLEISVDEVRSMLTEKGAGSERPGVTTAFGEDTITGLLGRSGGRGFGNVPFEDDATLSGICFVKESRRYPALRRGVRARLRGLVLRRPPPRRPLSGPALIGAGSHGAGAGNLDPSRSPASATTQDIQPHHGVTKCRTGPAACRLGPRSANGCPAASYSPTPSPGQYHRR